MSGVAAWETPTEALSPLLSCHRFSAAFYAGRQHRHCGIVLGSKVAPVVSAGSLCSSACMYEASDNPMERVGVSSRASLYRRGRMPRLRTLRMRLREYGTLFGILEMA